MVPSCTIFRMCCKGSFNPRSLSCNLERRGGNEFVEWVVFPNGIIRPLHVTVGLKATSLLFQIVYVYFIRTATFNFLLEGTDTN
jgi:hypothetical protein